MKYSTISIIAATFASVCSAAPAVAATTLPAKFGLFIVPVEGTAAQSLIPDIVTQPSSGCKFAQSILLPHPSPPTYLVADLSTFF